MNVTIIDANMNSSEEGSGSDTEFEFHETEKTLWICTTRVVKQRNGDVVREFDMNSDPDDDVVQDDVAFCTYFAGSRIMPKTALVILAEGGEEMEAVITVDVLRRGGVAVTLAGLDGCDAVPCSRAVTVVPDKSLADALTGEQLYDAVILPGGLEGTERLIKSEVVGKLLKAHENSGKIIAAICAAPTAFAAHGVAQNKRITSYPTMKQKITSFPGGYEYVEGERVVVDGNVVTSRGPGTAYWFGLTLLELLTSKEQAENVEKGMMLTGY